MSKGVLSQEEFQQMATAGAAAKAKRGRSSDQPSERWERRHRAQSFIQGKELDELEMEVETGLYENVDLSHGSRIPIMMANILYSKPTNQVRASVFKTFSTICIFRLFMVECIRCAISHALVLPTVCSGSQWL